MREFVTFLNIYVTLGVSFLLLQKTHVNQVKTFPHALESITVSFLLFFFQVIEVDLNLNVFCSRS